MYDYLSRRSVKRVYAGEEPVIEGALMMEGGAASSGMQGEDEALPEPNFIGGGGGGAVLWVLDRSYKFVWDGWNLLAELDGEET